MHRTDIPLVLIANSSIDAIASSSSIGQSDVDRAKDAMKKFIAEEISLDEVCKVFDETIKNTSPITRIHHILEISQSDDIQPLPHIENANKKCRNWKPIEDDRLLAGIHRFGLGDWKNVSAFVGADFTRSQCSQRWCRALNPEIEKEVWTIDEQKRLLSLVEQFGEHNWSVVAKMLGKRTDVQCRYRFNQIKKMIGIPPKMNLIRLPSSMMFTPSLMITQIPFTPLSYFNRNNSNFTNTFNNNFTNNCNYNSNNNSNDKSNNSFSPEASMMSKYSIETTPSNFSATQQIRVEEKKNVSLNLIQDPFSCPPDQLLAPLLLKPILA